MPNFPRQTIIRFVASVLMLVSSQAISRGQTDYSGRAQAESDAAQRMIQDRKNSELSAAADEPKDQSGSESDSDGYPLSFTMEMLDGTEANLAKYEGKPLLIVNTASKCGFTPQYKDLQKLHKKYAEKGLSVMGFPCNQFRGQEPGSSDQIGEFCSRNYGVSFDMFAKTNVKGDQQCDLYKYLTQQESSPKSSGEVSWNFEKFLVDGDGKVVARYASRVKPTAKRITREIEKLLAEDSATTAKPE